MFKIYLYDADRKIWVRFMELDYNDLKIPVKIKFLDLFWLVVVECDKMQAISPRINKLKKMQLLLDLWKYVVKILAAVTIFLQKFDRIVWFYFI